MIKAENICKRFNELQALESIDLELREGEVFGLIGTNGAGKSTLLRIMAGILKPDKGEMTIDGAPVYENPESKEKLFFISDEQYFVSGTAPQDLIPVYKTIYPGFDADRLRTMLETFGLDGKRRIQTFSKGMKKQLSILLGICSGAKYLLCDETFDGLDPVMRQAVKGLFAAEMADRDFTPIVASHNLRELEDICDHVGLLHKGGVILSKDLGNLKESIHRIQFVPGEADASDESIRSRFSAFEILKLQRRGSLVTMTLRGDEAGILKQMESMNAVFAEALPLSLEEIFISEMGAVGYDINKLLF